MKFQQRIHILRATAGLPNVFVVRDEDVMQRNNGIRLSERYMGKAIFLPYTNILSITDETVD